MNILYIQATGSGEEPFVKDITEWNELRRAPAMRMYFDHMNTYHISYAAFPNNEDTTSYIRARRTATHVYPFSRLQEFENKCSWEPLIARFP